jgi:hypothetical protein
LPAENLAEAPHVGDDERKRRSVGCCDKGGVEVMAAALSEAVLPSDVGFFLNEKRRW